MSVILVLIPLAFSIFLLLARPTASKSLALGAAVVNLAATFFLLFNFNPTDASFQHQFDWAWIPDAGIHFRLGVDGVTILMLILTNLLAPLILLTAAGRKFDSEPRFYGLALMMLAALNGVFMALDGLLFYIFYEMALIPIWLICAIWGGSDRIRTTMKFFIYTFIGSLFMLLSLIYVYLQTPGSHSFAIEDLYAVHLSHEVAGWVLLGFFLAFAVKMPVFPFHTWQPDTYTTSPTAGTMLLSGIMLKMGVYGVIRWMIPVAHEGLEAWLPIFMVLAVIGIVYASIIAIKQTDLKRLVAYSSIAHVGLIAAGAMVWSKVGLQGSLIQCLMHGINVVGLFFIGDLIERRLQTRTLGDMGGIAKVAPKFAVLFMIIMLGSVAVPLTNGFPGEFLLLNSVWSYNFWMGAVAGLTIIFGAVYMLRVYQLSMFGETNRHTENFSDLDLREWLVLGVVAVLVVVFGFFPNLVLHLTDAAVEKILGSVQF